MCPPLLLISSGRISRAFSARGSRKRLPPIPSSSRASRIDSARNSFGSTATLRFNCSTAAAVCGPIAHILRFLKTPKSPLFLLNLWMKNFTPLTLVKIRLSYESTCAMALSTSSQSLGAMIRIVGKRTGSAPSALSKRAKSSAWSSGRVITIRLFFNGLFFFELTKPARNAIIICVLPI